MPLLRSHHVRIEAVSPSLPWIALLLSNGLPLLLIIGLLVWMGRKAARNQSGMSGVFGLAGRLLEEETVTDVDLQAILGVRPAPKTTRPKRPGAAHAV